MKNHCKRVLPLLLTLILLVGLLGGTYALADGPATVTVGSGEPDENGSVSLEVSIANNPGFAAFNFDVICGNGLVLTALTEGELLTGVTSNNIVLDNGYVLDFEGSYITFATDGNVTGDGVIFTMTFETTEYYDASAGAAVSLVLGGADSGCFTNADGSDIEVEFVQAKVGGSESGTAYDWYYGHSSPYVISSAEELAAFASLVNDGTDSFTGDTVVLANDISLSAYSEWTPVGNAANAFDGIFDGAGNAVNDLSIHDATGGYKGLFGNVSGTVKDFTVTGTIGSSDSYITSGSDYIGGAVGLNTGTVSGVTANVNIYVNTNAIYAIGGVVGENGVKLQGAGSGRVENCANLGSVTGTKCVGGVVGRSFGTVIACFNSGAVTGNSRNATGVKGQGKDGIGGVVGLAGDKSGTSANLITYCYNTGTVNNEYSSWFGGIAGFADAATTISNCYDTGVIGPNGYSWFNPIVGGVDDSDEYPIESTYPAAFGNNYSLDGLSSNEPDPPEETYAYTVGTVKTESGLKDGSFLTAINADALYFVADSVNANGGYPILYWQTGAPEPGPLPEGYIVTVDNRSGSSTPAAVTGLTSGGTYSGEVTFHVACDLACVVAYTTDGGESYTVLSAAANTNGGYDFTVDVAGDMTIAIAIKGDASLNGKIELNDAGLAKAVYMSGLNLTGLNLLAIDFDNDGAIDLAEAGQVKAAYADLLNLNW